MMKAMGILLLILGLMLDSTGEHWQNYATMAAGLALIAWGYRLEQR